MGSNWSSLTTLFPNKQPLYTQTDGCYRMGCRDCQTSDISIFLSNNDQHLQLCSKHEVEYQKILDNSKKIHIRVGGRMGYITFMTLEKVHYQLHDGNYGEIDIMQHPDFYENNALAITTLADIWLGKI